MASPAVLSCRRSSGAWDAGLAFLSIVEAQHPVLRHLHNDVVVEQAQGTFWAGS